MKTNQQFKNAALDALRGNWGKAALVSLLYLIVEYAVSGPNFFQSVKMMQFRAEHHVSSIYQIASLYMDPEYQSLQQTANGVSGLSTLLYILVLFPLSVGFINAMRRLLVFSENDLLGNTLHIAFQNYWHKVWGMLWMTILTVLWGFLFIIPGIIKSLSYAMTPFILEENPELTASEAICTVTNLTCSGCIWASSAGSSFPCLRSGSALSGFTPTSRHPWPASTKR